MSTAVAQPRSSGERGLFGFNVFFGIILAAVGIFVGMWLGNVTNGNTDVVPLSDQNDASTSLAFLFGVVGFLIGLGFFNYPVRRLLGAPPSLAEHEAGGAWRYFRVCTDHKVVGIQYLVGTLFFFFIAGLNAMFMRTELLFPTERFWTPDQYLTLVSLHGTMMIMMSSAIIIGPLGNYLFPIMIGARRMAFPRLESLSFWLVPAAEVILLSAIVLGGIPNGWTGYGSLSVRYGFASNRCVPVRNHSTPIRPAPSHSHAASSPTLCRGVSGTSTRPSSVVSRDRT